MSLLLLLLPLGCGHCDGGIRWMGSWSETDPGVVPPDATFGLVGDGPGSRSSEELLADAGIDATTWFLLDPAGQPVDAALSGDWGGHTCLNGNTFTLAPGAPLAPGDHTLVLRLEAIAWDFLPGDVEASTWEGEEALVQAWTVVGE